MCIINGKKQCVLLMGMNTTLAIYYRVRNYIYLEIISLFISHRPSPVGSVAIAGPPIQNVQAGYIMS